MIRKSRKRHPQVHVHKALLRMNITYAAFETPKTGGAVDGDGKMAWSHNL